VKATGTFPGTSIELPLKGLLIWLNPFTGIIEGVRRPIIDGTPPHWTALLSSALWAALSILIGRRVFRRLAHTAIRKF
jgi:ABC-type polysaccharide/polyol phosphate export permease